MEEYNENIDMTPITKKMKMVNLKVSSKEYERMPDYIKKYCNTNVYTLKKIPRIIRCTANHGTCNLCSKGTCNNKKIHKKRELNKKYYLD